MEEPMPSNSFEWANAILLYRQIQKRENSIFIGLAVAILTIAPARFAAEWTIVPPVTDHALSGICWADSEFIAVGDSGTVINSKDGLHWTKETTGFSDNLLCVKGRDSLRVAGALSGTLFCSKNHGPWEAKKLDDTLSFDYVAVSPDKIIAGHKKNSRYYYGSWGKSWTKASYGIPECGVEWYANSYYAVGNSNTVLYGPDGISWTGTVINVVNLTCMAMEKDTIYGPEKNGGAIRQIYDLYGSPYWTVNYVCTLPSSLFGRTETAIAVRNGRIVAVGDSGLAISKRKQDSLVVEKVGTKRNLRGVAIGDSSTVIVGDSGLILVQRNPVVSVVPGTVRRLDHSTGYSYSVINGVGSTRISLAAPGRWEIVLFSVDGRQLARSKVHARSKSIAVDRLLGGTSPVSTGVLIGRCKLIKAD
jgi:hypothetical protein